MSTCRQSENYLWWEGKFLGEGAHGKVFQGITKRDGTLVAIKTFKRPEDIPERELEVLRKVSHENIVKLLDIEEECGQPGRIVVMELCAGGSLLNLLKQPQNKHGLCDDDFLLVLKHMTAGLHYLRDNDIIHRDLKPDNILQSVTGDGQVIFKLSDFGSARELQQGQTFKSLPGTEEYVHPDIYQQAVLQKQSSKEVAFTEDLELWSIGVTLYHLLTGLLPFRHYDGRKNKKLMHFLTSQKPSGVISAYQETENDPITFETDLPASCRISNGLKLLVTPLLAGLIESDRMKSWKYKNFFRQVEKVFCHKIAHMYLPATFQAMRVYVHLEKHKTYSSFQMLLEEQTNIHPKDQILLFGADNLEDSWSKVGCHAVVKATSEKSPIVVLARMCPENVLSQSSQENVNQIRKIEMQPQRITEEKPDMKLPPQNHVLSRIPKTLGKDSQLQVISAHIRPNDIISKASIEVSSGRVIAVSGILSIVLSAKFYKVNGEIYMDLTFTNTSHQPLSGITVFFQPYRDDPLEFATPLLPNEHRRIPIALNAIGLQNNHRSCYVPVLVKNNIGLFTFPVLVPIHVFFSEDGQMNENEFIKTWEVIPPENEVQCEPNCFHQFTDSTLEKLRNKNIFTVPPGIFETDMLYQSLRLPNGVLVLIKVKIMLHDLHQNIFRAFAIKSVAADIAQEVFESYEAILRE